MERKIKYFMDTEFMEDGRTIEMLSIGMVCEDGREYYAENADADHSHANPWVAENVLPYLGKDPSVIKSRDQIADDLMRFTEAHEERPQFWVYYGDYDWIVLCQMYGTMISLPERFPMFAMDIKQLAEELGNPQLPEQAGDEHHALADARWNQQAWQFLQIHKRKAVDSVGWPDGMEMIRQLREAAGLYAGAMPITPQKAWEEALEVVRKRCAA